MLKWPQRKWIQNMYVQFLTTTTALATQLSNTESRRKELINQQDKRLNLFVLQISYLSCTWFYNIECISFWINWKQDLQNLINFTVDLTTYIYLHKVYHLYLLGVSRFRPFLNLMGITLYTGCLWKNCVSSKSAPNHCVMFPIGLGSCPRGCPFDVPAMMVKNLFG